MTTQLNNDYKIIFVTGGTGFVGSYVIRDLVKAGFKVKALRRKNFLPAYIPSSYFENVEWVEGDVLDQVGFEEALENVDAVIHTAAKVSFYAGDRDEMFATNIEGTANVVNACIDKNIRRLVYVSSVSVFGKKNTRRVVNEKQQWEDNKLNTAYGISKYQAEMEVWRGVGEGLNAVIVNPSTILGYGDWNTSSSAIFKNVYNNFPWYTNGENGFVDVEDVSSAILQLLTSTIRSERFILNGDNWPYRKLFDTIADGFGKKHPSKEATPFLAGMAWRLEFIKSRLAGRRPLLTRESALIAQGLTAYDNSKILAALPGFKFTPLEETINKACKSYAE